jgi:hypothetical protein
MADDESKGTEVKREPAGGRPTSQHAGQGTNGEGRVNQGVVPSLVNIYQNSASNNPLKNRNYEFSKKQKRFFQRLKSFLYLMVNMNAQTFRVDLTTANGGDRERLRKNHQELVRRIKRVYGYDVISFVVETSEGNGVLHLVWGIKSNRAVYIPQEWLSEQWEKIHGAFRVWIQRMGRSKKDAKRVASYMVTQYLAGQNKFERYSYSSRKLPIALGKSWNTFKKEVGKFSPEMTRWRLNPTSIIVDHRGMIIAWEELLLNGSCTVGNLFFTVSGGHINFL